MVLCRAVDTLLLYFGFSGRPFVSTDLGCPLRTRYALHIFAAWVGCHSFIFFPLLLHEIPYVELFKTFRDYQFFFHCHLFNFHRRFVIKVEVYATGDFHLHLVQFGKQLRPFQIGEDFSGLPLLVIGRVVLSGYAYGFPDFVKADPGCLSLVRLFIFRLVLAELQFLRRYAREGFIELFLRDLCRAGCAFRVFVVKSSVFCRQLNAFSEVAACCVGMAAVVRVDAILKRLLPMMPASSSVASLCVASLFVPLSSSDRHNPAIPLKNRNILVSMIRS